MLKSIYVKIYLYLYNTPIKNIFVTILQYENIDRIVHYIGHYFGPIKSWVKKGKIFLFCVKLNAFVIS